MLVVARDRVQKTEDRRQIGQRIAASKPVCGPGRRLGQGLFQRRVFVQMVYSAL